MNKQTNIKELISIMQCPSCKVNNSLQIKDGAYDFNISVPLCHKTIFCEQCNEHYPITDDQIPIMWSSNLKRAFSKINQIEEAGDTDMNISAKEDFGVTS